MVSGDEPPMISAPWGEAHPAHCVPLVKGSPWLFYNPYSTPYGSSEKFVAWQISRAVAEVYGEDLSVEDIRDQYLLTNSVGKVQIRTEGVPVEMDFALPRALSRGPIFPLYFGLVITTFLLVMAAYFRTLRRTLKVFHQRMFFWGAMILLMGGHMATLIILPRLSEYWILQGVVFGTVQRWSQAQTGAVPLAYLAALVVTGLSWTLALHQFRQVEAPKN